MISKVVTDGILGAIKKIILYSLVLYFLYIIRPILVYLSVSLVVAVILNPTILFLKTKLKFNNTFARKEKSVFKIIIKIKIND